MSIYQYVYISEATQPFTADECLNLTIHADKANLKIGITGLLLYSGGYFMQALEGEKSRIRHLAHRINDDPRHQNFTKVLEGGSARRLFPKWGMGIINLDDRGNQDILNDAKVLVNLWSQANQTCVSSSTLSTLKYFRSKMGEVA